MIRYCFDTDVLSSVVRRTPALHVVRRMASTPPHEQATTSITAGELVYGAAKRDSPSLIARIEELLTGHLRILPFDADAATVYGRRRADLEAAGTPLDEADLRIAAICLSRDLTLVTHNERHFARVAGLRIENWLAPTGGA